MRQYGAATGQLVLLVSLISIGACRSTTSPPTSAPTSAQAPTSAREPLAAPASTAPPRPQEGEESEPGGQNSSGLDLGIDFDYAQEASAVGPAEGANADAGKAYPIDGYLSVGIRGRWTSDASDGDLYTFLSMDGGDSERHAVTFHITARASQDLAGGKSPGDPFFEISDTYSNGFNPRLYRAYVDVHSVEQLDILRLGRQQDIETPVPAYYDGVHLRSQEFTDVDLHAGAYGGASTHLFESTNSEDKVFGAYLGARPWEGGRARLDWMSAKDHRRSNGESEDMYSVSLWQKLLTTVDLEAFYSRFRDENRDLRLSGTWFEPLHDIQLRAAYYQLLTRQTTSSLEFDPFTSSLLDFVPYHQMSLSGSKGLGSRYRIAGGADLRRLKHEDDEGQFNRDFDRYFVTFSLLELLQEEGSLNLTTDFWDGNGKEYSTFGLDFAGAVNPSLRGSVGTFYSMYKVNSLTFEEREDVRTYFLRLDQDLTDTLRLDLNYQFEDADIADFHVLRMDVKWSF